MCAALQIRLQSSLDCVYGIEGKVDREASEGASLFMLSSESWFVET